MISTNNTFYKIVFASTLMAFAVCFAYVSTVRAADVQISDDGKTLIKYPEAKADEVYYVPDGVETIASEAFMNCASIRSIVIPEGVTTIGDKAFYGCRKLETISLPSSLTSLGEQAIYENDSLTGIYVDYNSAFSSIGGVLCSKDGKTLIKCPEALPNIEYYGVPKGVERIEKQAFANCRELKDLGLSEKTNEIDPEAFLGCVNLRRLSVPRGNEFFRSDSALFSKDRTVLVKYPPALKGVKYVVPKGVTEVAADAFDGCSQLETIELPETLEKIGARAFAGCSQLKTLTIPESVTSISDGAFEAPFAVKAHKGSYAERYAKEKNIKFETISEEEDVASTFRLSDDGKIVYRYVGKGRKATIPDGVEVIQGAVFNPPPSGSRPQEGVSLLKTIVIPKSVKEIQGVRFFEACCSLEKIEVAEDNPYFRSIDGVLFSKDGKTLISVPAKLGKDVYVAPDGVETIGPFAFEYSPMSNDSSLSSVVLPKSVKKIGNGAFYGCSSLTSIVLPEGVLEIGGSAFAYCKSLTTFAVPKSVKTIGDGAFMHCSSLKTFDVPETVEELGEGAFTGCSSLTAINVDENNPNYRTIDGFLCTKDGKTLIGFPLGIDEDSLRIPEGVVRIGSSAFCGCASLKTVVLPDSVEEIGFNAFNFCAALETIKLSKNIETIGHSAFANCASLKKIDLPESCSSLGSAVFMGCKSLNSIVVPNGVKRIESFAFSNCDSLTLLELPESIEWIEYSAFPLNDSLTVRAPEGSYAEQTIKERREERKKDDARRFGYDISSDGKVFQRLTKNHYTLSIPDGVETIAARAISGQGTLTKIDIPASVAEIGEDAFENCPQTKSIDVAENNANFRSIDGVLFTKDGKELVKFPGGHANREYVVPDGVETIRKGAFCYCPFVKSIVIPASVQSIDVGEFQFDSSLGTVDVAEDNANYRSIDGVLFSKDGKTLIRYPQRRNNPSYAIPSGIVSVDGPGFSGTDELKTVVVPESVEKIEAAQFLNCRSLTSIFVAENNANYRSIDGSLFSKDGKTLIKCPCGTESDSFAIPQGVETIGKQAFASCHWIQAIVLPDGCKKIEADAFYNCSKLTKIVIPGSVESIEEEALTNVKNRPTICARAGSHAEQIAKQSNLDFEPLD
ncbi:MAG: leucine-rich repeat protein [Thermoguttaceae bacterium]|nr:leucine-rich repeat protein [Thermoguttaceae bacterium]